MHCRSKPQLKPVKHKLPEPSETTNKIEKEKDAAGPIFKSLINKNNSNMSRNPPVKF